MRIRPPKSKFSSLFPEKGKKGGVHWTRALVSFLNWIPLASLAKEERTQTPFRFFFVQLSIGILIPCCGRQQDGIHPAEEGVGSAVQWQQTNGILRLNSIFIHHSGIVGWFEFWNCEKWTFRFSVFLEWLFLRLFDQKQLVWDDWFLFVTHQRRNQKKLSTRRKHTKFKVMQSPYSKRSFAQPLPKVGLDRKGRVVRVVEQAVQTCALHLWSVWDSSQKLNHLWNSFENINCLRRLVTSWTLQNV